MSKSTVTVTGPAGTVVGIGQSGSVQVSVAATYGNGNPPSGAVTYVIVTAAGATVLSGSVPLSTSTNSSTATIAIPGTLAAGNYTIVLSYSGDSDYQGTTAATSLALSIGMATSATTLASSGNPVLITTPVTFTATVSSSSGTPTRTVAFYDGTTLLGSASLRRASGIVLHLSSVK